MRRSRLVRLAALAAALWVVRWAVLELAAYMHRARPRHAPLPSESEHVPGAMPTPFDA